MKTIQILIDPAGQVRVETKGFAGPSCRDATKALEQALGLVQVDVPTPEMHQQSTPQQAEQQKIGG